MTVNKHQNLTDRIAQVMETHYLVDNLGGRSCACGWRSTPLGFTTVHHHAHVAAAIVAELGLHRVTGQGPNANHYCYSTDWNYGD